MSPSALKRYITRYPLIAVSVYAAVVAACVFATVLAVANVYEQRVALSATTNLLAQLETRSHSVTKNSDIKLLRVGSSVLEGQTVTLAGAALQERVVMIIGRVGGNVLSSQVDLQGTPRTGFVSLITTCEADQGALQQLLYELEAGTPFLFIDQLTVQVPQGAVAGAEPARLRILLTVSGYWAGPT
jgi:general secretion pathway protein M